jgi:hypothetical protein
MAADCHVPLFRITHRQTPELRSMSYLRFNCVDIIVTPPQNIRLIFGPGASKKAARGSAPVSIK